MVRKFLALLWKMPLASLGFAVALTLGGAMLPALGLEAPPLPEGADSQTLGMVFIFGSLLFGLALALLAEDLAGSYLVRWLALSLLMWVAYAVNNVIEGAIFSTFGVVSSPQAMLFTALSLLLPTLTICAVIAALFRPQTRGESFSKGLATFTAQFDRAGWAWRLILALLAFPVIYLTFGWMVEPLIRDFYAQGAFGLALPTWGVILPIQFVRSLLFLLVSLPVIVLWRGSRLKLALALGLALFVFVGGFSMLTTYWFSWPLRVFHSLEILADELLYAAALVLLFTRPIGPETARNDLSRSSVGDHKGHREVHLRLK